MPRWSDGKNKPGATLQVPPARKRPDGAEDSHYKTYPLHLAIGTIDPHISTVIVVYWPKDRPE
jgi:hypothetical protein